MSCRVQGMKRRSSSRMSSTMIMTTLGRLCWSTTSLVATSDEWPALTDTARTAIRGAIAKQRRAALTVVRVLVGAEDAFRVAHGHGLPSARVNVALDGAVCRM